MATPKEQWCTQRDLIEAWLGTIGDDSHPYGDYWRMTLVNPVVFLLCTLIARKISGEAKPHVEEVPLDLALGIQREKLSSTNVEALTSWHETIAREHKIEKVNVLDLGCGEGYLGRWLSSMGANYLGVDASRELIQAGRMRRSRSLLNDSFRLRHLDLEGDSISSVDFEDLSVNFSPHLVTGVIVLEHIDDPLPLLRETSRLLASNGSMGLFFTLNPHYLQLGSTKEGTQRVRATIASASQEVDCIARSLRAMHQLFRDSRLRIVHESPLYLPSSDLVIQEPKELRGIPPFNAFLVSPMPVSEDLHDDTINNLQNYGFIANLDRAAKEIMFESRSDLSLLTFDSREVILPQNNLGGDLLVLVDGSADLSVNGKIVGSYGPGELLGDLEAAKEEKNITYFPYPVIAGASGASVLHIPAVVAKKLMTFPMSMAGSLFAQLRNRLVVTLWNYNFRKRGTRAVALAADVGLLFEGEHVAHGMPKIDRTYVDKVARTILAASESEKLAGVRGIEGRSVFLSSDELAGRAQIEIGSTSPIQEALRFLMSLGIIDCFPGALFRGNFRELYLRSWRLVREEAAEAILMNIYSKLRSLDTWPSVKKVVMGEGLVGREAIGPGKSMRARLEWSNAVLKFRGELKGLIPNSTEWDAASSKYISFLARVNAFWWDKAPSYFLIHDPWLLRSLVLEEDSCLDARIVARSLVARPYLPTSGNIKTFSEITALLSFQAPGRGFIFSQYFDQFVIADLEMEGRLKFSGAGEGYRLPSWP